MSSEARPRSIEEWVGRVVICCAIGVVGVFLLFVLIAGLMAVVGGLDCTCWNPDNWIQRGLF